MSTQLTMITRWPPSSANQDQEIYGWSTNGATPQPDEPCRGWLRLGGSGRSWVETVTGGPVRYMNRSKRLVGLLAARPTGARHDGSAQRRRCPDRSRGLRDRVHRPDVSERLRAGAAVRGRAGRLRA